MANKVLTYVWEHSKQKGSALLMLIAMADQSNDHGVCFPATDTLAKKCRVTRRQAQRLVDQLEASGEIIIYNRQDPSHEKHFYSNVYVIKMPGVKPVLPEPGIYSTRLSAPDSDACVTTSCSHKPSRTMRNSDAGVTTIVTPTPLSSDTDGTKIVTPVSPDPLFNPTDNHQDNQKQQQEPPAPVVELVNPVQSLPTPSPSSAPPPSPRPNAYVLFEQNLHQLTPLVKDTLDMWLKDVPAEWVEDAIREAALNNAKSVRYITKILIRWQKEGRNAPAKKPAPTNGVPPAPTTRAASPGAPNLRNSESRERERKAAVG